MAKVDFMVYVHQPTIRKYVTKTVSIPKGKYIKLFCDFMQLTDLLFSL